MQIQVMTVSGQTVLYPLGFGEDLEPAFVRASNKAAAETQSAAENMIVIHNDGRPVVELEKAFEYGFGGRPEPIISGSPDLIRLAYQAWKIGRDAYDDAGA
ncbi:hypothetical protein [Burkholderia gladioli]|uniref:hypothetical protein n=1 Tax=Burkholderia gladioli TaxID=28095 RepID=UPI00163FEF61|nr:hypothetical protein [Burkholderia gladioli]